MLNRINYFLLLCIVILFFSSCSLLKKENNQIHYKIDYAEKYYYANFHLTNDSLKIYGTDKYIYNPITILELEFNEKEKKEIENIIKKINQTNLREEYSNKYMVDGFEIFFEITINDKFRTVNVSNCYVPVLANLVEYINQFVPKEEYKIIWIYLGPKYEKTCE